MQYARLDIATLHLDGADVRIKRADLLVVRHEGNDQLDWECVAYAFDDRPLEQGAYLLEAVLLDGRTMAGDAVLVRSVNGSHVLRGAGALGGFDPDDLPA